MIQRMCKLQTKQKIGERFGAVKIPNDAWETDHMDESLAVWMDD